jgi:hypothetical protein
LKSLYQWKVKSENEHSKLEFERNENALVENKGVLWLENQE